MIDDEDASLRVEALQQAVRLKIRNNPPDDDVVELAKQMYGFLTGATTTAKAEFERGVRDGVEGFAAAVPPTLTNPFSTAYIEMVIDAVHAAEYGH